MNMAEVMIATAMARKGVESAANNAFMNNFPTPTSADIGSALVVKKVAVPGDVIVPEQTVTVEDGISDTLTGVVESLFTEGTDALLSVNGLIYPVTIAEDGGDCYTSPEAGDGNFYIGHDGGPFFSGTDGTYTVALYVADDDYKYELDPYPGYDVVFKAPAIFIDEIDASDITIEKGTYADAYSKMSKGQPLRVLFYGYKQGEDDFWGCCTYDINGLYADENYNDCIRMQVTGGYGAIGLYNRVYAADNSGGSVTRKSVAKRDAYRLTWTESGISWASVG